MSDNMKLKSEDLGEGKNDLKTAKRRPIISHL